MLLNAAPGFGNVTIRRLLERFGSARNVLQLKETALSSEGLLAEDNLKKFLKFDRDKFLQNEYNLIARHAVKVISFCDEEYPGILREIPDSPLVLYIKGTLSPENELALAVVGSRLASVYGLTMAEKFSISLVELGFTIVSGLARGIDTAAHRACLRAGGRTLAVLGSGLARIYPEENIRLANEITRRGALISEFPMDTPPYAVNFPRRNRIVSGLSLGVVVVEASERSGALITSRLALEQGREVFALPGKIDDQNSGGVHRLIKQGAKLTCCVDDILEELHVHLRGMLEKKETQQIAVEVPVEKDLSEREQTVYGCLGREPVYIDNILAKCKETVQQVMCTLLELELKRKIVQLPGKYFARNQQVTAN